MANIAIEPLDLAALLASRICHDVIGPVGAIRNGLEVLEDDKDASMREFALELIRKSAGQAAARLQFCRLAFGAAGSAGAAIDLGDAEQVARGHLNDEKVRIEWTGPRQLLPKNKVKLLLNLFLVARDTIPRGGVINGLIRTDGDTCWFELRCKGTNARIPLHAVAAIGGETENGLVDVHAIQPYYTGLIARACAMAIRIEAEDDEIVVRAAPID